MLHRYLLHALLSLTLIYSPMISHSQEQSPSASYQIFSTELRSNPERQRSFFFPQLVSVILPGFDQWVEGQHEAGLFYSGMALAGLGMASHAATRINSRFGPEVDLEEHSFSETDNDVRLLGLGMQVIQSAGSLSAFASFRSAARSHRHHGNFTFLPEDERVDHILAAPFDLSYLRRPTTFVPLLVALGIAGLSTSESTGISLTGSDLFYAGAYSYNAGTHEEAMFRGWLMPIAHHYWDSPFWSNTGTNLLFAAAHISESNPVPWPQFAIGWYLGHLTQKNDWSILESVFVHTWWDVIIFTAIYLDASSSPDKEVSTSLPVFTYSF